MDINEDVNMGLRQKPIQEYRPTEEPKAAPTANAGESAGLEDVLQVAEAENTIQEKLGLLRNEIQEMELSRNALNEATTAQTSAKGELDEMKAFYAAKDSADNIVTGIIAQIVRVENTRFTAQLDEGSVAQVQETNRKAIEHEREVLAQHRKELKALFRKESGYCSQRRRCLDVTACVLHHRTDSPVRHIRLGDIHILLGVLSLDSVSTPNNLPILSIFPPCENRFVHMGVDIILIHL